MGVSGCLFDCINVKTSDPIGPTFCVRLKIHDFFFLNPLLFLQCMYAVLSVFTMYVCCSVCFYNVCMLFCLFGCLYPINVKTAKPIGPKFFVGPRFNFKNARKNIIKSANFFCYCFLLHGKDAYR